MKNEEVGKAEGFERAFQVVGGHGKSQWFLLSIICLEVVILTWNHLGYVFLGSVPNHICHIPELSTTNWTTEQIWTLSIPKISSVNEAVKWDSCHYYDLNYTEILETCKGNFSEALRILNLSHDKNTEQVKECKKWDYDHSIYQSTLATQFDLVCDRRYLAATVQSTYMAGAFIGNFVSGPISDKILGRRKTVLTSICLVVFAGIAAAFANSYSLFVCLRFIIAIGVVGCMQNCNVLILENSGISHRALFAMLGGVAFGVGFAVMPVYAYFLRDWSSLQLAFSLTSTVLLLYFWILPDSPRWLAANGKDKEALERLENIAKVNKMPTPSKTLLMQIIQDSQEKRSSKCIRVEGDNNCNRVREKFNAIVRSFKNLVSTREMRKRSFILWILFLTVAFVYYGFAFSTNLTSDPFILVSLGGLMEIPAGLTVAPLLMKWGRRPTTVSLYLGTGICAFAIAATPMEYNSIRMFLSMAGRFCVSGAFSTVYLLASELYPTAGRTTGVAVGATFGRVGSISSPYVADLLSDTYKDLPCVIFGVMALVASCAAFLLPETRDEDMVDQIHQLETAAASGSSIAENSVPMPNLRSSTSN